VPAAVGAGLGLLALWLMAAAFLWSAKPDDIGLRDAVRLLPDILQLPSDWPQIRAAAAVCASARPCCRPIWPCLSI